ncbi:acetyl-CoA acetyltransferase [Paenibacillus methanolicus]|uniref:Uncharacterized protein n=1 Tax=Paenibacillus methanolicus TaxID=582686 RepID=A0A5S5BWZ9_9BACL|nr:acetyl-CoA acetyltransferase [Paenibacillus methanolicus]TYP70712.1 hypothetical protein BCM02_111219 [Paenibacillus methanolicus]
MYGKPSPHPGTPIVYQAEPGLPLTVQQIRKRLHDLSATYLHRAVRVESVDGVVYEGIIVHVDRCFLYLQCSAAIPDGRGFAAPYSTVLPLVLYELLVITLLAGS